jgi:uncharacterized protein (DUF4415 family)
MEIQELLEQGIGGEGGIYMKKRIVYTDAPKDIEEAMIESMDDDDFVDFLPPPGQIVKKQSKTSVSLALDSQVVNHFKEYAKQHNTQYQTAINDFLLSHISR